MTTQSPRKIVLTGCTRGLGRALLAEWIAQGHQLFACGRDADAIANLRHEYDAAHRFEALDVTDRDSVREWAANVIEACGAPDLLVNNAGFLHEPAEFAAIPMAAIETVFAVNVMGVVNVLQAFLPAMRARGTGMIVNLSSGAGRTGIPRISAYCASKWAIEGLSKSIAAELPPGLGIVPLSPGMVDTDMLRACYGADAAEHRPPEAWARSAAPFILNLSPAQSGQSLSTP